MESIRHYYIQMNNNRTYYLGVLLWDIDGTLLRVKRVDSTSPHKNVLNYQGFIFEDSEMRLSGRTDFEILLELTKGTSNYVEEGIFLPAFKALDKESSKLDKTSTFDLLPGVVDMLKWLTSKGWKHGVLTGNTLARLKAKIKKSGIADFFTEEYLFGCEFGDSREQIANKARLHLSKKGESKVFILGDTPHDIMAARLSRFPVISVATGDFSFEELSNHNPDLLLRDLSVDAYALIEFLEKTE